MSAAEVIAEIKALAPEERERVIDFSCLIRSFEKIYRTAYCSKLAVMSQVGRLKMSCAI